MNDYFLYADDLKKKYKCYGHFYDLKFSSKNIVNCRSVLEIIDSSISINDINSLSFRIPDIIFIMMNPGSSYPLEEPIKDLKEKSLDFKKKKNLVLTRPDNTQYQLMRIGVKMGWSHLRVLNLSDLRNAKSKLFLEKVEALSNLNHGNIHSIFSELRVHECKNMLQSISQTIVIGWGQDKRLLPLVKDCFKRFKNEKIVSVESKINNMLTLHPSPMLQEKKEEWLNCIIKQLK